MNEVFKPLWAIFDDSDGKFESEEPTRAPLGSVRAATKEEAYEIGSKIYHLSRLDLYVVGVYEEGH